MKNRIFLVIFLALGLMACSKSKTPAYLGNTYEGKLGGETTLTYQILNEQEFRLDITSEWIGHHGFVCRYDNVADKIQEDLGEFYEPFLFYMDGCSLLLVDSVNDLSNRRGMLPLGEVLSQSGYSDLGEILTFLFYNNKTDEIVTMKEDEFYDLFGEFKEKVNEAQEETGVASISVTCRSELHYLGGIVCPRKTK